MSWNHVSVWGYQRLCGKCLVSFWLKASATFCQHCGNTTLILTSVPISKNSIKWWSPISNENPWSLGPSIWTKYYKNNKIGNIPWLFRQEAAWTQWIFWNPVGKTEMYTVVWYRTNISSCNMVSNSEAILCLPGFICLPNVMASG